ncbi:SE-cephalotoxin-like [Mustelus asterias]
MPFLQKLSFSLAFCVLLQTLIPAPHLPVMMVAAANSPAGPTVSPGDNIYDVQVQVETELELSEQKLEEANREISADLEILKTTLDTVGSVDDMNIGDIMTQISKQQKIVKIASAIGNALSFLNGVSAVAGFILSFFLPSELEMVTKLINKRFDEVNRKLDGLSNKLDRMEASVKASVALNTFLSTYIEWEYAIKNWAEKLQAVRTEMGQTHDRKVLLKLASDYIKYYDDNQLEGRIMNIYRISVTANNPTNRNLFDLFIEQHSCDIKQLSGLMIILKGLMISAAQQTLNYHYFKGEESHAKNSFEKIKMYLFQMREEFQKRICSCKQNTVRNAKKDVDIILEKNTVLLPDVLVRLISQRLTYLYPWYAWGIAESKGIGSPTCNQHQEIQRGFSHFIKDRKSDGSQKTKILVVWQDINERLSCADIKHVKTLVPYERCDKCSDNHIFASQNILTNVRCPHTLNLQCHPLLQKVRQWDWVGVDAELHRNKCSQPQACNEHGSCHSIPDTNQYMCICHPMYEGETCEERIVSNNEISKHLATLRKEFMAVNGVPTVVDIYFELQNGLKTSLNNIKDAITHTQSLVKHSEILYQASYIAQLFIDLTQGKKSLATFGQLMEKFFKDHSEHYILFRLKGIILGDGIADIKGEDFFNSFKKDYVSKYNNACTQPYSTAVNKLKSNLVYLDEAIGEALLMFRQWKIENGDGNVIEGLKTFTQNFQTRQSNHHNYWNKTSCPSLIVPDLIQSFCTEKLSYENMRIQLSCSDHKVPSPSSVQCVRRGGQLVWSASPRCNYQWAAWGSWSACSVTCGSGKQYHSRQCIGHKTNRCGSEFREEKVCNERKCCLSKDGNYKCANGQCIRMSQLCDGNNDCWNGEDESRSKCPKIIRSGDTIALKSSCTQNHWLSCHCSFCTVFYKCLVRPCPGNEILSSEWYSCRDEIFHIKLVGRTDNSPVHHGDEIGIHSRVMDDWVSCPPNGNLCATRSCPGNLQGPNFHNCGWERFSIFSASRRGGCSSDTSSSCKGKPLEHGDIVYIRSNSDQRYWLSDDGQSIRARHCPGRHINEYTGCRCEKWKIHKRL